MNLRKLINLLSPQNVYEGSDTVIYLSWTMYITSKMFYILSVIFFALLNISQYNEENNVLYWLPVDPDIVLAAAIIGFSVYKFLEVICQEPCNIPLELRKLTKSVFMFAIKISIAVLMISALVRYSNHDMIIFLSPLTSISVLLVLFKIVNCLTHIFLVKPSFLQLLCLVLLFMFMIPLTVIVIVQGFYSYAIQIWFNRSSDVFEYTKRSQKLKRVTKVVSLFLPSTCLALQLTINVFGFESSIDNTHWLVFLCIASAALLCQAIQNWLIDVYKWTQKQNPKRSRQKTYNDSLIDFIIENLIFKIITNNKGILTVRYAIKTVKKIFLLTLHIAFMTLIVDSSHLKSVIVTWISMVVTLIGMMLDWKDWKQKMKVAYKIGDIELISSTVDVQNQKHNQN